MKTIRNENIAAGFEIGGAAYGRNFRLDRYQLQITTPIKTHIIWHGENPPMIKPLYLLALISWLSFAFSAILVFNPVSLMFIFFHATLIRKTWISEVWEIAAGYISFALALVGLGFLISLLF